MKEVLIEVKDLSVQYTSEGKEIKAVNNISFQVNKGETLGIVGETGAGKTTTALAIMRLIQTPPGKIRNGSVQFDGKDLLQEKESVLRKVRGNKISMIFQDPMTSLNPVYTVGDQIAEVIWLHEKVSKTEARKKAGSILELVGIPAERGSEYPHEFSGGMKQRVGIAIALACNPQLLIADEPTTALDVTIQAQVLRLMTNLKEKLNTSMILITHDLGVVSEVCDKVAIMYAGEIVEYGTLEEIFRNPSHPYTQGLFNSIPNMNKKVRRLTPIVGLMPDPTEIPSGCSFHPRCPKAMKECKSMKPGNIQLNGEHKVSCHLFDETVVRGRVETNEPSTP
ncbi:peptide/nickel transport system ATP-binding protein [Evansella vedderi]|uniref:Peptide/nickel transport system ATP-binding protein n=1 Tax=Evansella vedderi TaxID=38282 RepID=A0ABT9ZS02_9BACI|nr:ABC transporter ATP-binding protein [Evansella vedderi]MDQ0252940.1 peptide/nickel transport system ATP-binding protein [Evansella vedderi]